MIIWYKWYICNTIKKIDIQIEENVENNNDSIIVMGEITDEKDI